MEGGPMRRTSRRLAAAASVAASDENVLPGVNGNVAVHSSKLQVLGQKRPAPGTKSTANATANAAPLADISNARGMVEAAVKAVMKQPIPPTVTLWDDLDAEVDSSLLGFR